MTAETSIAPTAAERADRLLAHLAAGAAHGYIGEAVSQLAHALQAAARAEAAGADDALVLAALFHDLGHLVAAGAPQMDGLGVVDHEAIGADLLAAHGCGPAITEPIREHVRAKRFLCWRQPRYLAKLSPASRGTLAHQGGPFDDAAGAAYAARPDLAAILAVRAWDDLAKDPGAQVPPLAHYRARLIAHLDASPGARS